MTATSVFSIKKAKYPKPASNLNNYGANKMLQLAQDKQPTEENKDSVVIKSEHPFMVKAGYIDTDGNYYSLEQYKLLIDQVKKQMRPVYFRV